MQILLNSSLLSQKLDVTWHAARENEKSSQLSKPKYLYKKKVAASTPPPPRDPSFLASPRHANGALTLSEKLELEKSARPG